MFLVLSEKDVTVCEDFLRLTVLCWNVFFLAVIAMDDTHLQASRRASSTSHRTTMSDSGVRKPASIFEINELYSALKDLAASSPAQGHRRQRTPSSNFDSSDSWTSGTDSPDIRSKMGNEKKNMKVIRSSSNITQRFVRILPKGIF